MQESEVPQNYPFWKKYLVKRKQICQQPNKTNHSMFTGKLDNQLSTYHLKDPFKKYQTLTTNIDNSVLLPQYNEENTSTLLKPNTETTQQLLPRLKIQGKLSTDHSNMKDSLDNRMQTVKVRARELSHHHSDPLCVKIQKTVARRVMQKFNKYNREWINSSSKRKNRSILQRSYVKTGEMLENIRVDAFRRKNTTHLQQILRNNIDEKTFVFPSAPCRQIAGLKGKGGNIVPLFGEIYMAEQVFKKDVS